MVLVIRLEKKVTFESARLKLTAWYLLIVMVISVTFSFIVYEISTREIFILSGKQLTLIRQMPLSSLNPQFLRIKDFEDLHSKQLIESKESMIRNLILTNLLILVLAGALSYILSKRTLKPIEEMMEIQNRFTSDASHELRTPLAAMKIEAEVALRGKDFNLKEARDLIKSNLEEIAKLENLSNGLLQMSRYQDSQAKSQLESFSLRDLIEEVVEKLNHIAKLKDIELKVINKNLDITLVADQNQISELLTIIIDNAIKYSPEKSSILIKKYFEKNKVVIEIKDHGIGVMASDQPYIFNRFYRADQSRSKEKYLGYGLGLSIAKEIVERHHGSIEVQSEPTRGATFMIKLPVKNTKLFSVKY